MRNNRAINPADRVDKCGFCTYDNNMQILVRWLISALVILTSAYILPGVHILDFVTALVIAVVLGVVNAIVRPVLIILTLPITIITFGLFLLIINALLVMLTTYIVPGFRVDSFWWALLFGVIVAIFNAVVSLLYKSSK